MIVECVILDRNSKNSSMKRTSEWEGGQQKKCSIKRKRVKIYDVATKCFGVSEIMVIDVGYNQGGFVEIPIPPA